MWAPEDQIMEKDLFEEREGFLMALNGVYLNMNSSSNYGGNLSAGIIDVMAQYYNCTTSEHNYSGYQSYAYDSKTVKRPVRNGMEDHLFPDFEFECYTGTLRRRESGAAGTVL